MTSNQPVAGAIIIGGGYSGTMIAAELARRGVRSVIVEGGGREGKGTAFSTSEEAHLLNVVAGRMGAWFDKPGDFAEEIAAEGYEPEDYVQRRRFGQYLRKILNEAQATGMVTVARNTAVAAQRRGNGWAVQLADGTSLEGNALVLAHGNQPPEAPGFASKISPRHFINNPWSDEGRDAVMEAVEQGGDILVIGTGLTMVDVVLSLDEAGHRGRMVALSRRGLAPRSHAPHEPAPVELGDLPMGSLTRLWRWLRRRGAETGWRAAVDSLRPHSHAIWQSLSEGEQRRFLRHARPWWDVHRHRIAPEVAGRIKHLVAEDRLEIVAGRIVDMNPASQGLDVRIKRRGSDQNTAKHFAVAINCTGPLGSIAHSKDRLLKGLFGTGYAKPDALGLGLEVDQKSRVVGAENAWAVGPLTKGRWWEITAVPDIRGQVADIAKQIAEEVKE